MSLELGAYRSSEREWLRWFGHLQRASAGLAQARSRGSRAHGMGLHEAPHKELGVGAELVGDVGDTRVTSVEGGDLGVRYRRG